MVNAVRNACGMLVAFAWGHSLKAQLVPVVDVGVTAARFTEENASVVGPQLRVSAKGVQRRLFESLEIGALGTSSAAVAYAGAVAGARTVNAGAVNGDLAAEVWGIGTTTSAGRAITALASARSAYDVGSKGSWLRVSGQMASRENNIFLGGSADAASWWRFARSRLTATVTQEWTRAELYVGPERVRPAGTTAVQYVEAGLNFHSESNTAEFDAGASSRRDRDAGHLFEQSFTGSAAYWTGESTAVVLSVAHQLPDYVRGGDAVDAVSVGVRFGQAAPARTAPRGAMIQFIGTVETRTVRIHAQDARSVEIMGDFTNWESRPMTRNGAAFESTMRVTSGTHRLMVRIDGGEWRPPANTPAVDDDFGGRVGLLVVP